jgi:hypothetical protein
MKTELYKKELDAFPLREELETLARYYHHLKNEHKRAAPGGAVRRRIEDKLLQVGDRFERLLVEWVSEPDLQRAWRDHLHNRAPAPSAPSSIQRLVFRGLSDAGSVVEIRAAGDELKVEVDGALMERLAPENAFPADRPVVRFRLNDSEFDETFGASQDALRALAAFRDEGAPPPWEHASELLADGLIDVHFDLTPRGRRALASR